VRAAKSFSARGRAATPHPGVSVKRRNAICQAPFHGGKLKFWFPDWHSMPACRRRAVPLQRNLNVNLCGEPRAAGRGHEADPQNLRLVDLSASCGDSVCRLKTKKPPRIRRQGEISGLKSKTPRRLSGRGFLRERVYTTFYFFVKRNLQLFLIFLELVSFQEHSSRIPRPISPCAASRPRRVSTQVEEELCRITSVK